MMALQKLLTEETEQHQERRSTGRKILIQEVDEGEDECLQTDGPNGLTDISSDDTPAGAPPPGHAHLACRSDLQQVLRLDASVTEAEQLLMEVTHLMKDRHPSGARRSVHITEVDDDDDDDEDQVSSADGRSIIPQPCNAYEFGQALNAARSQDDLLTCAELLRSVASDRLPRFMGSQLDAHTLSFITRALNTHLLHTHPELVYTHLQQLRNTHRLTMVLMMLGRDERSQLSQLFQNLRSVQTEAFSQNDITNLANKYL